MSISRSSRSDGARPSRPASPPTTASVRSTSYLPRRLPRPDVERHLHQRRPWPDQPGDARQLLLRCASHHLPGATRRRPCRDAPAARTLEQRGQARRVCRSRISCSSPPGPLRPVQREVRADRFQAGQPLPSFCRRRGHGARGLVGRAALRARVLADRVVQQGRCAVDVGRAGGFRFRPLAQGAAAGRELHHAGRLPDRLPGRPGHAMPPARFGAGASDSRTCPPAKRTCRSSSTSGRPHGVCRRTQAWWNWPSASAAGASNT